MGVRASRWVTMHGFALNVNADLGYFDNIIPWNSRQSGYDFKRKLGVDSVDEQEKVKILKHFKILFECESQKDFFNSLF
jgi:lipoyl(octanoyl) transferase